MTKALPLIAGIARRRHAWGARHLRSFANDVPVFFVTVSPLAINTTFISTTRQTVAGSQRARPREPSDSYRQIGTTAAPAADTGSPIRSVVCLPRRHCCKQVESRVTIVAGGCMSRSCSGKAGREVAKISWTTSPPAPGTFGRSDNLGCHSSLDRGGSCITATGEEQQRIAGGC